MISARRALPVFLPLLVALAATPAAGCAAPGGVVRAADGAAARKTTLRGDFRRELLLNGELEAVRSVAISAPQTSIFQMRIQFMAEEGELIRAGETLLEFDNSSLSDKVLDLEAQILDAESQVLARENELASSLKDLEIEQAEKQYEYDRTKVDAEIEQGIVSRREYGERRLAFEKAERELREITERIETTRAQGTADVDVLVINRDKLTKDLRKASQDMEMLSIKAPSDGLVIYNKRDRSDVRYQEGDSCWPGQGVMRLPDLSAMQVVFSVNEVDARQLSPGMEVRVAMDSFPGRPLTGRITHIPSMAVSRDEESKVKVFKVISDLSETWVNEMKPGMSVRGRVVVEEIKDAAMVARELVSHRDGSYLVRDPDAGPEAEPLVVHPRARNARHYVLDDERDAAVVARLGIPEASRVAASAAGGR